jgi:DNA repair protein RecO (recombination protein O)
MSTRTAGIVLHSTRYAENALILKIYTREQGLVSCIYNASKKKGGKQSSLFQPLTLIDTVLTSSGKGDLKRISEVQALLPYTDIPFNVIKGSIALFLNEMLYRCLRESHPDEEMFDFIKDSMLILDLSTEKYTDFHLCFLIRLSRYLGFYPQGNWSVSSSFFDLQEGVFNAKTPPHANYLEGGTAQSLNSLISSTYETISSVNISKDRRKELLSALITYYRLHIVSMGEIRSHHVLEEVLA